MVEKVQKFFTRSFPQGVENGRSEFMGVVKRASYMMEWIFHRDIPEISFFLREFGIH
jgi:hypothetical protein